MWTTISERGLKIIPRSANATLGLRTSLLIVADGTKDLDRNFVVELHADLRSSFVYSLCDLGIDRAFLGESLEDGFQVSLRFACSAHIHIFGSGIDHLKPTDASTTFIGNRGVRG
jgi:hypothetical protein